MRSESTAGHLADPDTALELVNYGAGCAGRRNAYRISSWQAVAGRTLFVDGRRAGSSSPARLARSWSRGTWRGMSRACGVELVWTSTHSMASDTTVRACCSRPGCQGVLSRRCWDTATTAVLPIDTSTCLTSFSARQRHEWMACFGRPWATESPWSG